MVQVSKEGTSATHSRVPFLKAYSYIVQYWELVKKQGKIIDTYGMQLSTVDSIFSEINTSNLCREAILVTP